MVLRRRSPGGPAVTASRTRRASDPVRERLARALAWHDAHVSFDDAVKGLAPRLRGRRPRGTAHSVWELVDHIRRAQHDILDFCRNPSYTPHTWPDDYWPPEPAPSSAAEWNAALDAIRRDRRALQRIARDRSRGLETRIPHGDGQTYLHEILLAIDHASYHVGQIVALRERLGAWPAR
jgi:uncharacterized damage-inducible protein DinB